MKVKTVIAFFSKPEWRLIVRALMLVGATIGITLLFSSGGTPEFSNLKLNSISTREIIAPFDFELLKSPEELSQEREQVRRSVMPVFRRVEGADSFNLARLDSFLANLQKFFCSPDYSGLDDSAKIKHLTLINRKFRTNLNPNLIKSTAELQTNLWWREFSQKLNSELEKVYRLGILDREPETLNTTADAIVVLSQGVEQRVSFYSVYSLNLAKNAVLSSLKTSFPEDDKRVKIGYEIILNVLQPNLIFDENITKSRQHEGVNKVALARGIVLKDERIIDSNERVTQEHLDKLRSLAQKKAELSSEKGGITGVFPFLGKIIFSGSILLLLGYLIFNLKPEIATNRNFFLILVILSAHLAFLQLILATAEVSAVLFPAALAAMLITIFYGHYIGFVFLGALALFAGALQGNDFQLTLLTLVVGSVAIISVKRIRSRTQILTSSIYLAITYIVFLTGYHFIIYSFSLELLRQIGIAVLNSILTSIFALGLAIILGNLFGITTELTLLELSDLNRPLLKRLSAIAPGTYHHSLEVGMMAEAAAEAVNANPLLARAGAYYHDIGKMEKRDYFIENQFVTNPHDALTPEASADILNSHIDEGLIIAEHNHLPRMIKDIITQHHGTSIMQYFYHKALKITEDSVDRERFKYKGPLPNSKESGIIMLADAVEAAVRSLGKSSVEEVKVKVRNIILEKFQEGQLDYCELSVRDLQTVEDSFVATLTAHAHHRIEYPSREEIEEEEIARARTNNI